MKVHTPLNDTVTCHFLFIAPSLLWFVLNIVIENLIQRWTVFSISFILKF